MLRKDIYRLLRVITIMRLVVLSCSWYVDGESRVQTWIAELFGIWIYSKKNECEFGMWD